MNNTNVFKTAGEMISNMNDTQLFNLDVNSFLNDVDKSLNKPQPHKPANKPHSLSGMGNSVFGTMKGMFDQNTGFNFPKTTTTQTSTHNDYLKRGTNGTSPNAYSPSVFGKKSKHTDWSEPSYTPLPGSINENSPFGYEVKTAKGTPSYKTDITPTVLNLSEDEKPLQLVKASDKKWIDFTSDILTAASFIPGLDTVTNLLSIPVDIAKGDWVSAGFDLLGAIPIAGEPADLAKVGIKAGKTLDKASDAARVATKVNSYADFPKILHMGRQGKHIVGHNNYQPGKSILSILPDEALELIKKFSGTGTPVGSNKERVNFKKIIGQYIDPGTGKAYDTTMGIIHYSKDGIHIMPVRPENWR